MTPSSQWQRFQQYYFHDDSLGFSLDISRMNFDDAFFARMQPAIAGAFDAMAELEAGAIANPGEKRMVGHYWLRAPQLAPSPELTREITEPTPASVNSRRKSMMARSWEARAAPSATCC